MGPHPVRLLSLQEGEVQIQGQYAQAKENIETPGGMLCDEEGRDWG